MSTRGNFLFWKQFPRRRASLTQGEAAFLPEVFDSNGLSLTFLFFPLSFREGEVNGRTILD